MIPEKMKAVQLVGHGGMDKLVYREGVYGSDTDPATVSTWRRRRSTLEFPRIQDADTVVATVGEGVPESRVGERVIVDFSIYRRPEGDESLGGRPGFVEEHPNWAMSTRCLSLCDLCPTRRGLSEPGWNRHLGACGAEVRER